MTRRFRFSVRALLVGMALLSVLFWWVSSNARLVRQRREFKVDGNGLIFYCEGLDMSVSRIRWAFGDRPIQKICFEPEPELKPTSETFRRARELFPEAEIGPIDLPGSP